ncbi:hypothetical protein MAFF241647_29920 [Ralstonia solanacearum]|uniref:DNA-binding transcriptional regulator (Modular protein) n=2 Tax=Ralstonia solanacearum species complex TaxID=3116862 RepID=A0A0S4U6R4_RALSL|nr:hypothetical protein MAFF241647_29920 [Ralstonia solanacearum]CUV17733.1 Putative DNA-binding transcriptional regulator (modular protein) [Ralstonia solanacearum]
MDIRPLHTEKDYNEALAIVSALVDADPAPGTPDGDRLEILSTLIERYEATHFPLEHPTAIEAIRFRMEQGGLTARDMQPYIGKTNRVYEVLNGKRGLSLEMIRRLHAGLHIPAEVLIACPIDSGHGRQRAGVVLCRAALPPASVASQPTPAPQTSHRMRRRIACAQHLGNPAVWR